MEQMVIQDIDTGGSDRPRYQQIYAMLRERIRSGAYPIGSNLPTEVEFCDEFGVSRYTVREALRRLVDQGMLARRQGSGSEIIATEPHRNFVHQVRSLADLFQYALDTHLDIRAIRKIRLPAKIATAVGGEAGSTWLEIKSVRRTHKNGEPICVTHSYIPDRLAAIEPDIPDCVGPLYALLEERSGETITNASQEIGAEPMTKAIANALGREPRAVALRLLRRYSSRNGTLIASYNWHPGDSFTYSMDLQRNPSH